MNPGQSKHPSRSGTGESAAHATLPPAASVDIDSPRFFESAVSLHSSRKLIEAADISKIILCDETRSLPDLQTRIRLRAAELRQAIDPIIEALPHIQWKRSVWHSFDLPAGVDTPHMMLDGSYYIRDAGDIREILFKGNTVRSVLEHLDKMIERTVRYVPPIDQEQILNASGYGIQEGDRLELVRTISDFLGPIELFPELAPSEYQLQSLRVQVYNLRSACEALAWINKAVADKMAKQIGANPPEWELAGEEGGIPVMRVKSGTLNPAHSAVVSPGLNAWESHPWLAYLNDLRIQLCAAQYGLFYLVSFFPYEGIRIPSEIISQFGLNFKLPAGIAPDSGAGQFLSSANKFVADLQRNISGWDALPISPMFLPTRFEADLSYSCLGIDMTRPELGAFSPLMARFQVSADKLYRDPARQFWLQISENPNYRAALGQMPVKLIASIIAEELGQDTLNITWLGVGSSWFERSITTAFVESGLPISRLRVHEIAKDDSRKESEKFRTEFPDIKTTHASGLFSEIKWNTKRSPSERALIASVGGTMANINFAETLKLFSDALREGDMLLIDCGRASEDDPRLKSPMRDIEKQWMWAGIHQTFPALTSGDFELELRKEERPHGYDLNMIIHEKDGCFEYKMMRIARFTDEYVHTTARDCGLTPLGQWEYSGMICSYLFKRAYAPVQPDL